MLIDFTCDIHGTNKLELSKSEVIFFESRKDFPYALNEWIKNNLKCPICLKEAKIETLKNNSDIPLRFKSCSFENFTKTKEKLLIEEYARNFLAKKELGTSLIFCGTTGTGKTHLSCALSFYLIENFQAKVIYAKAFDILRAVKNTYNKKNEVSFEDVHEKYTQADLLIIDEVGVQFGTDTEKQIFFEIINDRYENMKPTVLVTNLAVGNLKDFAGDRVIDRMRENGGKVIIFAGDSFRNKK